LPFIFFLSFLPRQKTEKEGEVAPWVAALRGMAEAGRRGKTERRMRGFDSPTYLERGRPVEGRPRWPVGCDEGGCGGGATNWEGGRAVGGGSVEVQGCAEAYL
jgi:hypothetical protein